MFLFRAVCLVVFLSHNVSNGWTGNFPVSFGSPGDNVTVCSDSGVIFRSFLSVSWFRLRPAGGIELKAYFSSYSLQFGRFRGALLQNSSNVTLTIFNLTEEDSGYYFPIVLESLKFTPGTLSVLAVTGHQDKPNLRMFVSHNSDSRINVLCELRGSGPEWTDPEWDIGNMSADPAHIKMGKAIDDSGVFSRISILSVFPDGGSVTINCKSHRKMTTISKSITIWQNDDTVPCNHNLCGGGLQEELNTHLTDTPAEEGNTQTCPT
ncbi:hypothetical protein GN956_G21939 [Arapaima gigas]